jgi:hypothetical protein
MLFFVIFSSIFIANYGGEYCRYLFYVIIKALLILVIATLYFDTIVVDGFSDK